MNDHNVVAVFDFDGTITSVDTFRDFIRWHRGFVRFWICVLVTAPLIVLYAGGFLENTTPKRALFWLLYKGFPLESFESACERYASTRLRKILRPEALKKIGFHIKCGHKLVIISASLNHWIVPWAREAKIEYVFATQAKTIGPQLTGGFIEDCFYGSKKVTALKGLSCYTKKSIVWAYGDGRGDKELLEIADFPFYRKF